MTDIINVGAVKKEFESSIKRINDYKKFVFSHLGESKKLFVSLINNISLLNYSQIYSESFDEIELVTFNEILKYKPDLLDSLTKKLFKNFDQILVNLNKNISDIRLEISSIEKYIRTFLNKNKQIKLEKLFINESDQKITETVTNLLENIPDYLFIFLVETDKFINKVNRMYDPLIT